MKFSVAIILLTTFQALAINSASQKRINLDLKNESIVSILKQIEKKYDYRFFYSDSVALDRQKVDVYANSATIDYVMQQLLQKTSYSYKKMKRDLVVIIGQENFIAAFPVKGKVVDDKGNPLSGVSLIEKGTTNGTVTKEDGSFSITVKDENAVLILSNVGYNQQEIMVKNLTDADIILTPLDNRLDEVVVVGYGTQKKSDLTGAISTIGAKDVGGRQTVQISEALQGGMPGVTVTRGGGAPGSGATIRVRGITTTGNNDPLILVDGVPVGNIDGVNPNDVENISVLKDASSAAIYGSRGAAGVILITTKRAKAGQANMEYNYEYGAQKPTALPEFAGVQDYMRYFNEQAMNDGASSGIYAQAYIDNYLDSNRVNPDKFPNTDWQKTILKYKTAPRQRHDLAFTVGTEKVKSKISLGYQNVGAFYDNNDYKRFQFRVNNDMKISEKLSANLDVAYRHTEVNGIVATPGGSYPIYESRVLSPIYDDYYTDGRYAPGKEGRNPIAQIYEGGFNKDTYNQLMGRLMVNYQPIKDLTLTALVSPTLDFNKNKRFSKQIKFTDVQDPSRVIYTNLRSTTALSESRPEGFAINGQFLANYKKTFAEKHNVELLGGYEENYYRSESIGASRDGFALTNFPYLSVGSLEFRDNSGSASESALRSYFGRLNYNFNEKYLLQGNIRYDQSSRFAKQYRSAVFPSLSAGWVLSQEKFMQSATWLSFLKLRGSYGEAGNERIGDYPYQSILSSSTALFYQGTSVIPLNGYAQVGYAVQNISWETTATTDIGVDMAFLNNKLTATADYFYRKTRDILLKSDIPNYVGYEDPYDNLGTISAKGWELELGWRDRIGKLQYSAAANISDAKTKVLNISNPGSLGNKVNIVGSEFNEWYGYKSAGLFQTADEVAAGPAFPNTKPGDVKYLDLSGDGKISSDADRVLLGGSLPRYQYGGNLRLNYEGIDFALVFQGIGKRNIMLPSEVIQPFAEAFGNMPQGIIGRFWSPSNTPEQNLAASFPRLSRASNGNNYQTSDFYLASGAYFRIKNITLGYTINANMIKRTGIKALRFYVAANDLLTINKLPKYISVDPESEAWGYPIVTTIMGGINIRF